MLAEAYGGGMTITRAMATGSPDPEGRGRVQVVTAPGDGPLWAARVFSSSGLGDAEIPAGAAVWVVLEQDDPLSPVVLGLVDPLPRTAARTLQGERLGDAWDQGHAAGTDDAAGRSDTPNPYR